MLALFYFAFLLTMTSSWSIKAPPQKTWLGQMPRHLDQTGLAKYTFNAITWKNKPQLICHV